MTNPQASDPRRQPDIDRIQKCLNELVEHFDSVQIFATRYEPDSDVVDATLTYNMGVGNWYARYGQIGEWLIAQDERTRQSIRRIEEDDE